MQGFTQQQFKHAGERSAIPCRMVCSACCSDLDLACQAGRHHEHTHGHDKQAIPQPDRRGYQAALPAGDVRSRLCDWVVRKYSLPGLTGSAALPLPFLAPFLSPPSPFFLAPAFLGAAACGGSWRATTLGQPGVTVKARARRALLFYV